MRRPNPLLPALALLLLGSNAFAGGPAVGRADAGQPNSNVRDYRLDDELTRRAARPSAGTATTRVIVALTPGSRVPATFARYARTDGDLAIINAAILDLPDHLLRALASHPAVLRVHFDRPARLENYRTRMTIGSAAVVQALGFTGRGVGVAVVDSGIASWHDDLTSHAGTTYPYGNQRVSAFVDLVGSQSLPYDDNGHGSHVGGIIAGNGTASDGRQAGVAPDAALVVLKALDGDGNGTIGSIIRSLDWVLANRKQHNIRVVNLSVGAAVHESYWTDPLTLAAKRLVDAGVVVVAAAGNLGTNGDGRPQYGGVGAPGNAPWVLTIGASSTMGTTSREDDAMAGFSSRGPTYLDWSAKPDVVAPGVGTVSLAAPGSSLYATKSNALQAGSAPAVAMPYLSLSGTSMAAPVVSGTVALMLQANPNLTPNAVKAILQYTAQPYAGYDLLTQGAGFLDARGAVELARYFARLKSGGAEPSAKTWSRRLFWGNHELTGGFLNPSANAFRLGTTWGVAQTASGDNIVWGTTGADNIVWGTSGDADNIVWGTAGGDDNIVWGTSCGGADCDNIVWGTADADNIVWGTAGRGDNIVWGTSGADNVVWGTSGTGDDVVWGVLDIGDLPDVAPAPERGERSKSIGW